MRDLKFHMAQEKSVVAENEWQGLYCYLRYFDLQRTVNEYRTQYDKFNRNYIRQLLLSPFLTCLFLIRLYVLRRNRLIFLSGRRTPEGRDIYVNNYINSKSVLVNYSSNISINAFPLILVKIMAIFVSRMPLISTGKAEASLPAYLIDSKRIREYLYWKRFWKLLLRLSEVREVYFTSLNFFLPAIEACRELSIETTEIAHAIVSPMHPSYNYGFENQIGCFADNYIENAKSFGAKCTMIDFVKFHSFKRVRLQRKANNDNWLIIPGPFESCEDVDLALKRIRQRTILLEYLICVHPLDSLEKFVNHPCSRLDEIDLYNYGKVVGWSSNLLSELYFEGLECYTLDTTAYSVYESRNEKILML